MLRRVEVILLAVAMGVVVPAAANAQSYKKSTLSGVIVSSVVSVPAESSAVVYTAPSTGFFILTQYCGNEDSISVCAGSCIPVRIQPSGSQYCTTFTPGIAVPPGATVTCINGYPSASSCLINGVLSKN